VNVVTSPTAGSRRVLSRLVGVKSQSSRKAVMCGIFVAGDARPRPASSALAKNRDLAPAGITDTPIERRLRLGGSTPPSLRKGRPWTDPLPGTDDTSFQALTLASFGDLGESDFML